MNIHRVFEFPFVFNTYQFLVGAPRAHRIFLEEYIKPFQGASILDVGCGTGDITQFFPDYCIYTGLDFNKQYIEKARRIHDKRFQFLLADASQDLDFESLFDICFCFGVLHHLNNESCKKLLNMAFNSLKPGGSYVCMEPCLYSDQNWVKKAILQNDRGRFVRDSRGYESLITSVFSKPNVVRRDDVLNIPYSMVAITCLKEE